MIPPLLLLAIVGGGAYLLTRNAGPQLPPAPPPPPITLPGLVAGQWYRILVRSTLDRSAFGLAAGQQIQSLLGAQGFDVRETLPDATDPYVYRSTGLYRGTRGGLGDVPGVILLGSAPATQVPGLANNGTVIDHVDERPAVLQPGKRYYARASVSWPKSMLVTKGAVESALAKQGGTNIEVYTSAAELPASWPASERGGDLFIASTYQGPPAAVPIPGEVVSLWREA